VDLEVQSYSSLTQNLSLKKLLLFAEESGASAAADADVVDAGVDVDVDVDDVVDVDVSCPSFLCSPCCCCRQAC